MTTVFLMVGRKRPFCVLSDDGITAVCGKLKKGDEGVGALAASDGCFEWAMCGDCKRLLADGAVASTGLAAAVVVSEHERD